MKCSACGEPLGDSVGFCTSCGEPAFAAPPPPPGPEEPSTPEPDTVPVQTAPVHTGPVHTVPVLAAEPEPKRRTPLLVGAMVLVAVLVAAGVWLWAPWQDTAEATESPSPSSSPSASASSSPSDSASSSASASASRSASASPSASSSASATAAKSISLSGYSPSSSTVRDGMVIYRTSNGVSAHVPGESIARTYPAPAAPTGQEVSGKSMDIVGTGDAPKLAALVEIRTPASGLDPEKYATVLRTYDEKTTAPLAEAAVTGIEHADFNELTLHGSGDGSLALESEDYSEPTVRFFNAALQELGQGNGVYTAQHGTTVILADRDDDCLLSAWSTATGTKLWESNFGTVKYPYCTATLDAGGLAVAVNGTEDFVAVVDPLSGTILNSIAGAESIIFDSAGPLAVVEYNSSDATLPALRIFDTTTWKSTVEVTSEQGAALNLQTLYLFGSKLYIENTDEQPVLDALTGEKLAADWTMRPSQAVSDDWTLVTDESEGTYSLEPNIDGVYPGPWW